MRAQPFRTVAFGIATLGCLPAANVQAQAQVEVRALELIVEPPTLISLGFEWFIDGDADRDAAVAVAYRRAGERDWRESLPLLRVQNERTFYVETLYYTAPNMFAGSVFELAENTEYEVRFTLTDPDGVNGDANASSTCARGPSRKPYAGGTTYHVYPFGYTGPKQEPAFTGLLAAYYKNALGGDWSRAAPPRVQPGDTILVHAGRVQGLRPLQLQPRDPHAVRHLLRHAVGRHVLSDARRHGRAADRDQSRRRRRGRLRRRRQQRAVQRHGRGPHVFRRHHVPQHELRPSRRARKASPAPSA